MSNFEPSGEDAFLSSSERYRSGFIPENVIFNSNLQEFARRVEVICGLETGGSISPDVAHQQILQLYQQLTRSRQVLGIDNHLYSLETA